MRTEDQESALLKKLDGVGCFHVLILILGCIIALCLTFGIISISLVMPVNERDLELNSSRKGGIEACLFMGMLVGSVLFGWLSDSCGRRVALLWALPLTSASLLFSAFSFHWAFFLVMVFCIGVGKQDKRLQLLLDRMQRLNSCGHTKCYLSRGKANAVKKSLSNTELLTDGSQTSDSLQFSNGLQTSDSPQTYNGLNSMALCEQGLGPRSQEGVDTQAGMNQAAGRDGESSHKDKDARNEKQEQVDGQEGPSMWQKEEDVVMEHFFGHNCGRVMLDLIHKLIKQVSTFYCSSHTYKTIILHVIFFTTLFGYYGAKLWFPEIFKRILIYKDAHPFQIKHHSKYQNQSGLQEPYVYYQDALFITLSTIPSSIIAAVMFKVLGAKILLVGSGLIASVGGIAMWFVPMEHGAVLALCCVYNAGISLAQSALKIGATNLYPTAIRSTALGLHSAVGRLGAIAANIVFGELVDTSLALPMLLSAGMVLLGTGVGLFIPRMYSKQDKPMLYRCASKAVLCCKAG